MKYLSVCSGIEAATVAWKPLGWEAVAFSEIEKFPCSVLVHHYPNTPNYGDMTKFKEWPDADVDLLVGGTPCQSFSIAGLRKGLDDPRGNLMLTFGAIAGRYRPRIIVWENVPGVLSSNAGKDFASFLGLLTGQEIKSPQNGWQNSGIVSGYKNAYGVAYRVLDAQFIRVQSHKRAVPQRRRRVFVVGYLGDWRRAAAVLFERESLRRNTPPIREAGKRIAGTITRGFGDRGVDSDQIVNGNYALGVEIGPSGGCFIDVNPTLDSRCKDGPIRNQVAGAVCMSTGQASAEIGIGIGTTLNCNHEAPICFSQNSRDELREMEVAGALAEQHGMKQTSYLRQGMSVRRLMPVECERLQGFPDNYTLVPHNGKRAADGPRYKALGNSMAVNCMRWIGDRITKVEMLGKVDTN